MQRPRPLMQHLTTNLTLLIHPVLLLRNSRAPRSHLNTLPRPTRSKKLLNRRDHILNGNKHTGILHFGVELEGGDGGLHYVWADGVEGYAFFGEVDAVGTGEAYYGAVVGCEILNCTSFDVLRLTALLPYRWVR